MKKKELKYDREKMLKVFMEIWKKSLHKCGSCGDTLFREPSTANFDHLLLKEQYPELACEEWNIMLICQGCHDRRHFGKVTDKHQEKIDKAKEIYESKSVLQVDQEKC
jgi:5-methylcytosine-specific restriction endonuclease McrA